MPPLINVDIMIWFTEDYEDHYIELEKKLFESDLEWVARQYAEVNNGHCIIYYGEQKVAEYKVS